MSVVRVCSCVVAFNFRRTVVNPGKEPSALSPCHIESLLSDFCIAVGCSRAVMIILLQAFSVFSVALFISSG